MSNQYKETEFPSSGPHCPKRNNRVAQSIGRFVLRTARWRIVGDVPNLAKMVIIGGPHTSYWDFIVAMAILWTIDLDVAIMGKKEALEWPVIGRIMRHLGTFPVDRQSPIGVVDQAVARINQADQFVLGLSPEGTRRKVARWKTGFYRIATQADVPIFPITVDYHAKCIFLNPIFTPSDDMEADMAFLQAYFEAGRGLNADQG